MKQAAVLGKPIGHSKSPVLHRAAYQLLGVELDYQRIELDPSQAPDFAARLRSGNWAGCSVTMPLKDVFVPLMDTVSPMVRRLGALNTIIVGQDRSLHAENTDIYGIVQALADVGISSAPKANVLGAGNTALAALEALALLGVEEVNLIVRDPRRAGRSTALASELGMRATVRTVSALGQDPLTICTLPPHGADSWLERLGQGRGVLLDVAYDPWPSQLAASWDGPVINGLSMLVHQAVEQVRLFSGLEFDQATREKVTNAMYDAIGLHRGG